MISIIHPKNPDKRKVKEVVNYLKSGGVIIYPTDTVYALGCDAFNKKALEKICRIKKVNVKKHNFSFVCYDLSQISKYTKHLSNPIYKLMKKVLPGPFTFILQANNNIPKFFKNKKREIGIRVPNNNIARTIVKELGSPIATTSIKDKDEILEYSTDPELIHQYYINQVEIVIDGGYGDNIPSTIINCIENIPKIERQGKGEITQFL
ncbi:MAG: threonylcarbamoyl-AMP synthase [Flavobacteriales bacterium]|nr:threonylcarbamoyl-AMP synthase [Flavobacteriales bacterium]